MKEESGGQVDWEFKYWLQNNDILDKILQVEFRKDKVCVNFITNLEIDKLFLKISQFKYIKLKIIKYRITIKKTDLQSHEFDLLYGI